VRLNLNKRTTKTIANELEGELDRRYELAWRMAQADLEQYHEMDTAKRLPRRCPYTLAQVPDAAWWPERAVVTA
jgi:hypothetical protein